MILSTDQETAPGTKKLLFVFLGAIFLCASAILQGSSGTDHRAFLASAKDAPAGTSALRADQVVVAESPELIFVNASGIRPATPPVTVTPQVLGAIVGGVVEDPAPEIFNYVVEDGDTVASLATKFGISQDTILWSNDLPKGAVVRSGDKLIIPPVSGTLHLVRQNDTVGEIAGWYSSPVEEIVNFNRLSSPSEIFAGDLLIIPGGVQPKTLPRGRLTPLPNTYFIYPIPAPHRVTQGLHPYNAVDFSNGICGQSVYAAAGGTVQRTRHISLGGSYARILHANGVVTYYGHLSGIVVQPGQKVFQGQLIGYVGHTGYTIPAGTAGCHLHFEVRGAANPFAL